MTRRTKGTYTITDNRAAAYIKRHRDASSSVLMALSERSNFTRKGPMTVAELMVETDLRERGTEKALCRLAEVGLAHQVGKAWAFGPANHPANTGADDRANPDANDVAYSGTEIDAENTDSDDESDSLKEVEGSGSKASFASREQASGLIAPPEEQGPDGPAADAAPGHPTPSQDSRTGPAPVETARAPVVGARPAPIRAADPGDDADALQAFHTLAGYGFCATYRLHLARWFDAYSPAFLRLAWRVAPTVPGVKVAAVGFVWLLNREREWPDALKAQYERDLRPQLAPVPAAVARVQPGDLLRWPDGRTAAVERVDSATVVTDSEDDARGYVPLAQIGRGVEVLRS